MARVLASSQRNTVNRMLSDMDATAELEQGGWHIVLRGLSFIELEAIASAARQILLR